MLRKRTHSVMAGLKKMMELLSNSDTEEDVDVSAEPASKKLKADEPEMRSKDEKAEYRPLFYKSGFVKNGQGEEDWLKGL